MATATSPSLTEDQVDDLLYLARVGETTEFITSIDLLAKTLSTTSSTILTSAIDPNNGNGLLHMASANGHIETLKSLLALSAPISPASPNGTSTLSLNLNLQNASGNTPLHWASLNGHLEAVKLLVAAGAEAEITNHSGRSAADEAENGEKWEVVEWLSAQKRGEGSGEDADEKEGGVGDGEGLREMEQAMGDAEIGKS